MKKRTAKNFILVILMTTLTAASALCFSYAATGSSFEYKYYKEPELYDKALKRTMADVYYDFEGRTLQDKVFPIPGLIVTQIESGGKRQFSSQYVPQGMCRAGDYLLIRCQKETQLGDLRCRRGRHGACFNSYHA